jgi:hypothetical protein
LEQSSLVSNPNIDRVKRLLQELKAAELREGAPSERGPQSTSLSRGRPMPRPFWVTALFLLLAVAMLWTPTRWVWESVRTFHAQRERTPALLSGLKGPGPAFAARRPTEIRPRFEGTRPTTFRLLAPAAREVYLGGSFNSFRGSRTPMVRGEDGIWEVTVPLAPGRHTYKFKVDGKWLLDPTNPEKTPEPRERSLINVPE